MSVFRSNKNIFAQVIDDSSGKTLASASSLEKDIVKLKKDSRRKEEEIAGFHLCLIFEDKSEINKSFSCHNYRKLCHNYRGTLS